MKTAPGELERMLRDGEAARWHAWFIIYGHTHHIKEVEQESCPVCKRRLAMLMGGLGSSLLKIPRSAS